MSVRKGYCPPAAMRYYLASERRAVIMIIDSRHERRPKGRFLVINQTAGSIMSCRCSGRVNVARVADNRLAEQFTCLQVKPCCNN